MPCYLVTVFFEDGRAVSERIVKCDDDELLVKQAMMYGLQVMLSIKCGFLAT